MPGKLDASKYVGQTFGYLVGLSVRSYRLPNGKLTNKVLCQCRCGSQREIFTSSLTQGRSRSCGCDKSRFARITGDRNAQFKGIKELRASLWNAYKRSARTREIPFDITMAYAWSVYELQNGCCAISGEVIGFGPRTRTQNTSASLDRIDHACGYVEGNVQWVHKRVNMMRNASSVADFVEWCRKIVCHQTQSATT
jgi:hypothetical protein